jgi:hypothetical protein
MQICVKQCQLLTSSDVTKKKALLSVNSALDLGVAFGLGGGQKAKLKPSLSWNLSFWSPLHLRGGPASEGRTRYMQPENEEYIVLSNCFNPVSADTTRQLWNMVDSIMDDIPCGSTYPPCLIHACIWLVLISLACCKGFSAYFLFRKTKENSIAWPNVPISVQRITRTYRRWQLIKESLEFQTDLDVNLLTPFSVLIF